MEYFSKLIHGVPKKGQLKEINDEFSAIKKSMRLCCNSLTEEEFYILACWVESNNSIIVSMRKSRSHTAEYFI